MKVFRNFANWVRLVILRFPDRARRSRLQRSHMFDILAFLISRFKNEQAKPKRVF